MAHIPIFCYLPFDGKFLISKYNTERSWRQNVPPRQPQGATTEKTITIRSLLFCQCTKKNFVSEKHENKYSSDTSFKAICWYKIVNCHDKFVFQHQDCLRHILMNYADSYIVMIIILSYLFIIPPIRIYTLSINCRHFIFRNYVNENFIITKSLLCLTSNRKYTDKSSIFSTISKHAYYWNESCIEIS
jgi:hypothetical protein